MTRALAHRATSPADCRRRRFAAWPWLTTVVFLLHCVFELQPTLWQIDRTILGEPWRMVTGQLVHWDASHRFWDVAVFLLFAALAERFDRVGGAMVIGTALAAVSTTFWFAYPELTYYRGLSGIDTALVAFVGVALMRTGARPVGGALLIGLAFKIALELRAGSALFAGDVFVNVPWVHAAGALAGVVVGWARVISMRCVERGRPGEVHGA